MRNFTIVTAKSGNGFARKADGTIMGSVMCLGVNDSIENYEEREYTDEERVLFGDNENLKKNDYEEVE
jgi:hypothetical protein